MPSKDREADVDDRSREKRHQSKSERKDNKDKDKDETKDKDRDRERDHRDRDRDRDRDRGDRADRDRDSTLSSAHRHHHNHHHHRHGSSLLHHHKSSRSSKLKLTDSETGSRSHRRHRASDLGKAPSDTSVTEVATEMTDVVPELLRGVGSERGAVPYPTFSKAHSKEFLHSKEDVSAPTPSRRTDPLTPEATDLGPSEMRRSKSADSPVAAKVSRKESRRDSRPPSPPETDLSGQKKRSSGLARPHSLREVDRREDRPHSRTSGLSRSASNHETRSKVSKVSSQATFVKTTSRPVVYGDESPVYAAEIPSVVRSASTSVPRKRSTRKSSRPSALEVDDSPDSAPDSSPKTPTQTPQFPPPLNFEDKQAIVVGEADEGYTPATTPAPSYPPPPPPPPALQIQEPPRVDYLMQNGGLPHTVPKTFISALPRQNGTRPSVPPLRGAETLFAPFFNILEQYHTVLNGHGSIAVATGHRTVARRLLDRLENVFSRELSSKGCSCVMCCENATEPRRDLGWGDVLERVSGRIDLPQWPPFDLESLGTKAVEDLADIPARPASPVKMDPDIAEEFREHYLRQTKRVRAAVDKWMTNCDKAPAPSPQEVDDETLSFAILTSLEPEDQPYFSAILSGSRELQPSLRAPTPIRKGRNDFVVKTGLSLQRLYRLQTAPRDAETVMYLVRNPQMHDLLHTISDINPSEWEILTSGRFDGFLWSGADDDNGFGDPLSRKTTPASGMSPSPYRGSFSPGGISNGRFTPGMGGASRNTTPFSAGPYSRGATPASFTSGTTSVASLSPPHVHAPSRAAVSHDEETEIAVLAEVEREIFAGMEALEDAFETLHQRAETVRAALRQRGAGLAVGLQQRRHAMGLLGGADVLPSSGGSGGFDRAVWVGDDDRESMASESEWGGDDASEIRPDDSASNISSSRHRRPKRRKERATPAPIEEEEEREEKA